MLAGVAAVAMTAVGTTTASAKLAVDTGPKTVAQDCIDMATGQKQGVFTWEGPTASSALKFSLATSATCDWTNLAILHWVVKRPRPPCVSSPTRMP